MNHFTPISAAIGGGLIGLSAVLLMALTGRIAGVSGIFAGQPRHYSRTKVSGRLSEIFG